MCWLGQGLSLDFLHNYQPFFSISIDRECCSSRNMQQGMTFFYRLLNVLWVVIAASNDNQIFEPSCDEEFPIAHETEVASAQEGTFAAICQVGTERLLCLLRSVPVSLCYTGTRDPDFANALVRALGTHFWLDNDELLVLVTIADTYQGSGVFIFRRSPKRLIPFQRSGLESPSCGENTFFACRDNERGLCQTITRIKLCPTEATRS